MGKKSKPASLLTYCSSILHGIHAIATFTAYYNFFLVLTFDAQKLGKKTSDTFFIFALALLTTLCARDAIQ